MYSKRFTALTGSKSVARPRKTRPAPASWFSHVHPGVAKPRARCPGDTGPDTRVGGGCVTWPDWSSARQTHTRVVRRVSSHAEKEFISEPILSFLIHHQKGVSTSLLPKPTASGHYWGCVARHLPSVGPRGTQMQQAWLPSSPTNRDAPARLLPSGTCWG